MKNKTYRIVGFLGALLLAIGAFFLLSQKDEQIVYVDLQKVYDEMSYAQELNAHFKQTVFSRNRELDSLEQKIRFMHEGGENEKEKTELFRLYREKSKYFQEKNEELQSQVEEKIWNQINTYTKDFGRMKGYSAVLGGNGTGNIMYGDPALDKTQELVEYINNKHRGT